MEKGKLPYLLVLCIREIYIYTLNAFEARRDELAERYFAKHTLVLYLFMHENAL